MGTAGNVKGSSLGRRIIQDGNLDLRKGIKTAMLHKWETITFKKKKCKYCGDSKHNISKCLITIL